MNSCVELQIIEAVVRPYLPFIKEQGGRATECPGFIQSGQDTLFYHTILSNMPEWVGTGSYNKVNDVTILKSFVNILHPSEKVLGYSYRILTIESVIAKRS